MRRSLVLLLITSAAALAAENVSQFPTIKPDLGKAFQKATRQGALFGSGAKDLTPLARLTPRMLATLATPSTTACAIPLTPIPSNPNIDPNIRSQTKAPAAATSNMPHLHGLPSCSH